MKSKTLTGSFLLLTMLALVARAQSIEPAKDAGDTPTLVVGDWYVVTIERHDVKQQIDGLLVKATDDWIVLGLVLNESTGVRSGVPYLRDMPIVGGIFGRATRKLSKAYCWIPRDAVHLDKRQTLPENNDFKAKFKNDLPVLEGECDASSVQRGRQASEGGYYAGVVEGQVIFEVPKWESVAVPDPKWGGLPIVGDMLVKTKWTERKIEKKVPLEDVLYLMTEVPLKPEPIKLANSK